MNIVVIPQSLGLYDEHYEPEGFPCQEHCNAPGARLTGKVCDGVYFVLEPRSHSEGTKYFAGVSADPYDPLNEDSSSNEHHDWCEVDSASEALFLIKDMADRLVTGRDPRCSGGW